MSSKTDDTEAARQEAEELLERYISAHIDAEPAALARLGRMAQTRLLYGRMCSGHIQGRLLKMLVEMTRPRRVLEIGTFVGYSAVCLAEGLGDGGEVHTVEVDDELEDIIRATLAENPAGSKVTLHIGDALSVVPTLAGGWDLVFIDGNKRDYAAYYRMTLPLLNPGGYILADNTLWYGKVAEPEAHRDRQTAGVIEFNDMVAADDRVEKVILPLRDGLTIIRKKD